MLTREQLPNDIEQLKDIILEQQALIEQLQQQVQALLRHAYGQRSEKQKAAKPAGDKSTTSNTPHGRNPLPDNLPREDVLHSVSAEQLPCPQCGHERTVIGEDVSEQLDYVPGHLKVIRHKRQKVACKHCQGEITLAELPPQPIDKGLPTAGLLAHVIVDKYQDHLPLHRQESRFARDGIAIARSTLCDWIMQCAMLFEPLVQAMKVDAFLAPKLNTDDTPVPVQAKEKVKLGRLWVYVSDTQNFPKVTLYDYSPSRAGRYPQAYLANYRGYLQADAFAGYDELYTKGTIIEVGCFAHARRKFEEIVKQSQQPGRAHMAMEFIGQLYQIERDCKNLTYLERYQHRQQRSRPILDAFKAWLDEQTTLPKSPLGKAIAYTLNHWQALTNYLLDGCLSIDNNSAERAIRPLAIGRNNWTFAGSDRGGKSAAIIYSLIETCKMNSINGFDYLKDVLTRLPRTKMKDINTLLPYYWQTKPSADNT
jgi:transposase